MNREQSANEQPEEGLEIPVERIDTDTLQKMIEEFVTREWSDPADSGYTLEEKVAQVLRQLRARTARIMYDVTSETWNIVAVK
ncbi:MAG: YheU family protein [Geobacteraceae bacterium]|nr:YheU family protein [Geobacteraceae bacterium]